MSFAAIDFGTSNSAIGIFQNGKPTLLAVEDTHTTVPTALFFPHAKNAPTLIGRAAISAYLDEEPGRFMRGLKSVLGTSLFPETTLIRGRQTPFADIIGTYMSTLLKHAEEAAGTPITHLLLGRPVHFLTNQPEADAVAESQLRTIAENLGINHIAFLTEPLAAAYHYEQSLHENQLILVVDIGGGTTDLTVIRLGPDHAHKVNRSADILASHGLRLGGTDIDQAFALTHVMPHLGYGSLLLGDSGAKGLTTPAAWYHQLTSWHRIHRMYEKPLLHDIQMLLRETTEPLKLARLLKLLENHLGHRLMFAVESSKIELSNTNHTTLNLNWLEADFHLPLSQTNLATAIHTWRESLTHSIAETLTLAGVQPQQLAAVFLTGGPSAMPLVQITVQQALPTVPLIQGDQLTSVGQGLTLAATRLFA